MRVKKRQRVGGASKPGQLRPSTIFSRTYESVASARTCSRVRGIRRISEPRAEPGIRALSVIRFRLRRRYLYRRARSLRTHPRAISTTAAVLTLKRALMVVIVSHPDLLEKTASIWAPKIMLKIRNHSYLLEVTFILDQPTALK